jgi:NADPH-dependent 2,4-dienoyl-CoA reductase/sulfur reductase-like enzyme
MTHNLRKSRRRSRRRLHDCRSTVMTTTVRPRDVQLAQPFASATPSSEPAASASGQVPRVVIVGAGFGGLNAATALRHEKVEVTLIDRRNYHLFQPLLYQVATAGPVAGGHRAANPQHPEAPAQRHRPTRPRDRH